MSRVRIVCKTPRPAPPSGPLGIRVNLLPTISDCELYVIGDDGVERPFEADVRKITFGVVAGEVAVATLEFHDVEVDLEALLTREESHP